MAVAPANAQYGGPITSGDTPYEGPGGGSYHSSSSAHCSDHLGYLRRVYEEDLESIEDPQRVFVVPVCVGDHMMRSDGNAGALLQTIAANDALVEALWQKGFRHEDVVAIRITGGDSANLYVFPFRD